MPRSKKEIDKELMYKKIMPTSSFTEDEPSLPVQQSPSLKSAAPQQDQSAPILPITPPLQASPVLPITPPLQAQTMSPIPVPPLSVQPALPIIEQAQDVSTEPVNIMESLIEARIDAAIEKFRCCKCDKCRKAIAAFALNKLPPFYVATQNTEKMKEAQTEYAGQVATALVQAILSVKAHPSH